MTSVPVSKIKFGLFEITEAFKWTNLAKVRIGIVFQKEQVSTNNYLFILLINAINLFSKLLTFKVRGTEF